jgi:hypothetical protein
MRNTSIVYLCEVSRPVLNLYHPVQQILHSLKNRICKFCSPNLAVEWLAFVKSVCRLFCLGFVVCWLFCLGSAVCWLFCLGFVVVILSPSRQILGWCIKSSHDRFLTYPSKSITENHPPILLHLNNVVEKLWKCMLLFSSGTFVFPTAFQNADDQDT